MKKIILLLIFTLTITQGYYSQKKKIWATSFLNQPAPKLVVDKWLSDVPNTKGKFILIDFWATWCPPCRKGIPDMNSYAKKFKKDLVVIGISHETEAKVRKMKSPIIEYFYAVDPFKRMFKKLGILGIPHVILIDPDGIVRWEGHPQLKGFELTEKIIAKIIRKYRKK